MDVPNDDRPALTADLTGAELRRWYWLREELARFARDQGLRTTGGKEVLTTRVAAHLDGAPFVEPTARAASRGAQLAAPFAPDDVVPPGQRCSQALREWFTGEVGAAFRFDHAMRDFFARADGTTTLGDAVALWHRSRSDDPPPIEAQFEYNRFTRQWHDDHPTGTAAQAREAWWRYRSRPVDRRESP